MDQVDAHSHDSPGSGSIHDHPEFFDEAAKTWDHDPAKVERARVVATQIVEIVDPSSDARLLEYGAGTALVAESLRDHVGAMTLADTSSGMREVMAAKVADGRLPGSTRIWDLDLESQKPPAGEQFDLVVAVQVLHHVHDLATVLAHLAELLAPGGHLCVVDLETEDGSFHGEGFGGHHGFRRDDLAERLEVSGFADVAFRHAYDIDKDGRSYPLFLATARR